MIAAKFINLQFLRSEFNIADIVSKNWSHQAVYPYIIRQLLHYKGDTANLLDNDLFFDYTDNDDISEADNGEYLKSKNHSAFRLELLTTLIKTCTTYQRTITAVGIAQYIADQVQSYVGQYV